MIIFHWLDFSQTHHGSPTTAGILDPLLHSFRADMIPMGLVFGVVSCGLALATGYHRLVTASHRDTLAQQLLRNERYRSDLEGQTVLLRRRNEQLAQLEQANRRSTRFMVHDFKTHLGTILGFANLLLDEEAPLRGEAMRVALRRIRRQGLQLQRAVDDLLEMARLQARGSLNLTEEPVGPLLAEAMEDFALPAHARRVQVGGEHLSCEPVRGDGRLLVRVLNNLIANALRHNPPGIRVTVDARPETEGREVLFSCIDDGRGIPAGDLATLFKEFSARPSSAEAASSGLGLAFCKAAVEAHGGRIWCESVEGAGSRFFFTIPCRKEVREHDAR